jgi:hypothetical protein
LSELFDADGEGQRVEPGPAVLARDENSHEAGFGSSLDRLIREAMLSINLGREGEDDALRKLAHRRTEGRVLGGEFEIQLGVN